MKHFFKWLKWHLDGKPYIEYDGGNCGCCGAWVKKKIRVSEYESVGRWWDTWTLCDDCVEGKVK
jgi:hypothetical protein